MPEAVKSSKDVLENMDNAKISAFHFKVCVCAAERQRWSSCGVWQSVCAVLPDSALHCAEPPLCDSPQAIVVAGMCVFASPGARRGAVRRWGAQTF